MAHYAKLRLKTPLPEPPTRPNLCCEDDFMRESLLEFLRCPECIGALQVRNESVENGEVMSADLLCTQCPARFTVDSGVPRMRRAAAPATRTQKSFGKQWQLHSRGNFERGLIYSKSRGECLEDFRKAFALGDLAALRDCMIFDAGCGSGELTADLGQA